LLAKDRNEDYPFIVGGGPCAYNPEPIADFFDFFVIGEGEEILLKVLKTYEAHKDGHWDRNNFLKEIASFYGIYVPAFYEVDYNENGTINKMYPIVEGIPTVINKAMIEDVNTMFAPETMIVPFIETIHDRVILEMFRGCTHGCRFCQAGMIYRPIREKSTERLVDLAEKLIASTGYDTISLSSLSSCDYSSLNILISDLMDRFEGDNIGISLPSLRLDSFSIDILKEIEKVKKSGLTFAPEAGSQRLRDVINKGVNQEDLIQAVTYAFNEGWSRVKLYFMIGLPTETEEDLMGIKDMSYLVRDIYFNRPNESKKGSFGVTVSTGCFVPKPFTPFQWVSQNSIEEFNHKISLVKTSIRDRKVNFNYSDVNLSYLEGIFARGDRRLSNVLIKAWEKGCKYDGWSDQFRFDLWMEALEESNIDGDFYSRRARELDEVLPWDFINPGVSKEFLKKEYLKSLKETTTMDCRLACGNCGIVDCSMRGVFN
ncbi:MAG: TIGR03960 family B12-binding radical SAM protein, partial [Tissierellia bacterium]|nr:TIGR03960 family B12-binding radical SAM protein [Tissierellia bacterium]